MPVTADPLKENLVMWLMWRVEANDHGCLTGDCPHTHQGQCVDQLISDWWETYPDHLVDDDDG